MSESESDGTTDGETDTETGDPAAVGVKLGSTRTVISMPNGTGHDVHGSLTCLATYEDPLSGEERVVYGDEAATEYPDRAEYMLRSGLPEDGDRAGLAADFFEDFTESNGVPTESVVVYAIPTIDNEAGLENLESVIEGSDIGETAVRSYPESLCGSIPAFGDDLDAIDQIFIAVNLGSTNLEACAYRRGEQLSPYATGAVTGSGVDRRIATYIEDETQGRVTVDPTTAREYKEGHADFDDYEPFTDVIQQPGGGSHEFTIERSVMDAVDEYLDEVVDEVANRFLPSLASDSMKVYKLALDRPIVVTGGMACIPGLLDEFEHRLGEELRRDVDVTAPDSPDEAAAIGAYRIAERLVESSSA